MHNKVQIFGLQRSGTNLIEWSLINNFKDIKYSNLYDDSNIPNYIRFNEKQVVKHHFPTLEYSDYAFIVYKKYKDWLGSMIKYRKRKFVKKEIHDEYLKRARELPSDKIIIHEYTYIMNHYKKVLEEMADKFNLILVDDIKMPNNRLTSGGARVEETTQKFIK